MLVLTRRTEESLLIGDNIEIKIVQVRGSGDQATVRIGIVAPSDVRIFRKEVYDEVRAENRAAAQAAAQAGAELPQDLTALLGAIPQGPMPKLEAGAKEKKQ